MAIKGDIRDVSIVDFLQLMRYGARTGVLEVIDKEGSQYRLVLRDGIIIFAFSEKRDHLGDMIVNNGLMKEEEKDHHLNEFSRHHKDEMRFGKYLVKNDILEKELVVNLIKKQIKSMASDILSIKEGEFSFEPGEKQLTDEDILVSIDINDILFTSLEQSKEWKEIRKFIKSDDDIFSFPPENYMRINKEDIKLSWLEWNVLSLLNGKNSVKDISEKIGESTFAISKILKSFLQKNLIERETPIEEEPEEVHHDTDAEKPPIKTEKREGVINRIISKIKSI